MKNTRERRAVRQRKRGKTGITPRLVQMVRNSPDEHDSEKCETYKQARECLWESLSNLIGAAKEVTLATEDGVLVSLRRESSQLKLSFSKGEHEGGALPTTRMYDYYFPEKEESEDQVAYEGRRLEVLDELVDRLLVAQQVER